MKQVSNAIQEQKETIVATKIKIKKLEKELEEKTLILNTTREDLKLKKASLETYSSSSVEVKQELKEASQDLDELQSIKAKASKYTDLSVLNQDISIAEEKVNYLEAKGVVADGDKLESEISKLTLLENSLSKEIASLKVNLENETQKIPASETAIISSVIQSEKKITASEEKVRVKKK